MKTERVSILQRIISRGGFLGSVAAMYMEDESKGNVFLKECFDQCHNRNLWDFWGKELTLDLISYRVRFLRMQYLEVSALLNGRFRA